MLVNCYTGCFCFCEIWSLIFHVVLGTVGSKKGYLTSVYFQVPHSLPWRIDQNFVHRIRMQTACFDRAKRRSKLNSSLPANVFGNACVSHYEVACVEIKRRKKKSTLSLGQNQLITHLQRRVTVKFVSRDCPKDLLIRLWFSVVFTAKLVIFFHGMALFGHVTSECIDVTDLTWITHWANIDWVLVL